MMKDTGRKKRLLVSNDDGYQSHFLRLLVDALVEDFDVCVVAPLEEQSWVGRAMSRSGTLEAKPVLDWPCPAWSVSGRPADCVNIGLNHLIDHTPDAVISGMNLGFNVSLPLTLGSGTVAAATEGALAGLPAIAFSLSIPRDEFMQVSQAKGQRDERGEQITRIAAEHARKITHKLLGQPHIPYTVHNIKFPPQLTEDAPVKSTTMTISRMPSLFTQHTADGDEGGVRRFSFDFARSWHHTYNPETSDIEAVKRGEISHTTLRWDRLSLT